MRGGSTREVPPEAAPHRLMPNVRLRVAGRDSRVSVFFRFYDEHRIQLGTCESTAITIQAEVAVKAKCLSPLLLPKAVAAPASVTAEVRNVPWRPLALPVVRRGFSSALCPRPEIFRSNCVMLPCRGRRAQLVRRAAGTPVDVIGDMQQGGHFVSR